MNATAFRYITDAITREEALAMLKEKAATRAEREATVRERGYPAYVTSAGWLGYSDEKVARLTREAVEQGFNHFKMKVGADRDSDLRRGKIIRSIIDDPQYLPASLKPRDPNGPDLVGKNAGPTGCVLMIDANQVWDVPQAIDYVKSLAELKPWCAAQLHRHRWQPSADTQTTPFPRFIEEPTAPDDVLGHAAVRKALKPYGIGVATGEHAHNRMIFKQLLQAEAIDVCQIDSCRLAGVSEVLSVLLIAAKCVRYLPETSLLPIPRCVDLVSPYVHTQAVWVCANMSSTSGACSRAIASACHAYTTKRSLVLSLIDYIAISGTMERNVLEFVDHLHEHFLYPCSINKNGRYNVPSNAQEGYRSAAFPPPLITRIRA